MICLCGEHTTNHSLITYESPWYEHIGYSSFMYTCESVSVWFIRILAKKVYMHVYYIIWYMSAVGWVSIKKTHHLWWYLMRSELFYHRVLIYKLTFHTSILVTFILISCILNVFKTLKGELNLSFLTWRVYRLDW